MSQVVKLTEVKAQPNMDAVTCLREALTLALAGDIRSVTIAAIKRGGERTVLVSDCDNYAEMLGVLTRAVHMIHKTLDDEVLS